MPKPKQPKKSPIKILIVDDEQLIALDVQNYLKKIGYGVTGIASSGKEALEMAAKTKPDLILMDIVLKGSMDGIETARRIRVQHDIPSIFLTAYIDDEKIERAKVAQPFGYILKPFDKKELRVAIEMAYNKHKWDRKILESEKNLKHSLEEKDIMLKEIHHRVKNNMQLISSLLSLQATHIKDKAALNAFDISQSRIRSMMLIHENLYASKDFANIDFAKYISELAHHLSSSYGTGSKGTQLKINVHGILLNMNFGVPCGLIVNELVINAFKHAFPKEKKGKHIISISMHQAGRKIKLTVSDNGIGLSKSIDPKNARTLGFQLVDTLVKQLNGTLNVSRDHGTSFTIIF
jgi:two-component sensor histidine kinase